MGGGNTKEVNTKNAERQSEAIGSWRSLIIWRHRLNENQEGDAGDAGEPIPRGWEEAARVAKLGPRRQATTRQDIPGNRQAAW